jgi:DNA-binding MarR family transcriptional regulator
MQVYCQVLSILIFCYDISNLTVDFHQVGSGSLRYDAVTMEEEDVARAIDLLIDDVLDLARALRASGDAIAGTAGQTQARWLVLKCAAPGHYTVPDIARRIDRHRQSVQRITDELTTENLARYTPNPDHARSSLVQLTRAGHDALAKIEEHAHQVKLGYSGNFTITEIAAARAVLAKVLTASRAFSSTPAA